MRIHHATAAKASKLGIELVVSGELFAATLPKQNGRTSTFYHAKAPEALAAAELEKMLRAEYPAIRMVNEGWEYEILGPGDMVIYEGDTLPSLATLLEACEEADIDPTEGLDDEAPELVVVAAKYKTEYAARGNPDNCGDELAQLMDGMFVATESEIFDWKLFESFLALNGVDLSGKWASLPATGGRGWQGRYRMNGRQKLEQIVAERGTVILLAGRKIKMSPETIEVFQQRHSRVLEKRAKAREVAKA